MEPLVKIENVTFRYENGDDYTDALKGVSLEIEEGEFVAILGRNGSGKSTLAKMFNGILLPGSGSVKISGMDTSDEEKLLSIRRNVGMVFQNPDNQIVASVVEEDVAFAPENLGLPPEEIRRRVDEALKLVDMQAYRLHSPHLLSGGQKQRVAIAGVIAMRPRCIVLDEPTAMLDPEGRQEVLETITRLCRENGITIVLITHHMSEGSLADRVYVMSEGKVAFSGAPREVFADVEGLRALDLTAPDSVQLLHSLKAAGMSVSLDALTEDECAAEIARVLKK